MAPSFNKGQYAVKQQAARAYRNAAQNILKATLTKVAIDTIDYDPFNIVDLTNNRITPTKAGYYVVVGHVATASLPGADVAGSYLYFNNVLADIGSIHGTGVSTTCGCPVTGMQYFDGVDDYIELWTYHTYAGTLGLSVGSANRNFLSLIGPF